MFFAFQNISKQCFESNLIIKRLEQKKGLNDLKSKLKW